MLRSLLGLLLLLLVVLLGAGVTYYLWQDNAVQENPFDPIIAQIAKEHGLDPFLVRAIVWRESKFDPRPPLGAAQERGLMQVTPEVGREWALATHLGSFQDEDLWDPTTNLRAGTWYLNKALRHWIQTDDPVPFALAEYNAGRSNARKWVDPADPSNHLAFIDRISFPSTRKYVDVIMAKRDEFRRALAHNRWYKDYVQDNTPAASN